MGPDPEGPRMPTKAFNLLVRKSHRRSCEALGEDKSGSRQQMQRERLRGADKRVLKIF